MPIPTPPPTPHWQDAQTAFVENVGQAPGDAKFVSLSMGYQLEITAQGARLNKTSFQFAGAAPSRPVGRNSSPAQFNYYAGKVAKTGLTTFHQVVQPNLYPGIDAVYYGSQSALEYDVIVHPGGDPAQVRIQVNEAAKRLPDGSIQVGAWRHKAPIAYQEIDGQRQPVAASAVLVDRTIAFELGSYDKARDLIIDPVLTQIRDLVPRGFDSLTELAVMPDGGFAVAESVSRVFQVAGATSVLSDDDDIRIARFTATGGLLFQTLIAGEGKETVNSLAMDATGATYAAGETNSTDLPTNDDAFQKRRALPLCLGLSGCVGARFDAFALKLSPTGQRQWLTYLGSNKYDTALGIAVAANQRVYVTGHTSGSAYPEKNEFQNCRNEVAGVGYAFLTVLNSTGTSLVYSTCLRPRLITVGTRSSESQGVALDSAGNAYIIGTMTDGLGSRAFPVKGANGTNPFQGESLGEEEVFVAKLNPNLAGEESLVYSTLLGGSGKDTGSSITVDEAGQACVGGFSDSLNFPLRAPDGFATPLQGNRNKLDFTVTCFNANGSGLLFSNMYGGSEDDINNRITRDSAGNLWLAGFTFSSDFNEVQPFEEPETSSNVLIKLAAASRQVLMLAYSPSSVHAIAAVGTTLLTAGKTVSRVDECARPVQSIQITQGPIIFDLGSGRFKQTINVAHAGPLLFTPPGTRLIFTGLPAGVQVANATGTTTCLEPGNPFLVLPLLPSIAQGGVDINLEFIPSRRPAAVSYTPVFASIGVLP